MLYQDIRQQVESLLSDSFLTTTPWRWLTELPRYLRAIPYRLEKLTAGSVGKDIEHTFEIASFWEKV